MDRRPVPRRGFQRPRGDADRRPSRRSEPRRPRLARRRHDPALRAVAARGRAAAQPADRDRARRGEHRRDRRPPRHGPVGRAPGDGGRDRARAHARRLRDGPAQCAPHRPGRALGRAGGGRGHGVDPLHQRGQRPADGRALGRHAGALLHQSVHRGHPARRRRADRARLRHQRDRARQGAGGLQQEGASAGGQPDRRAGRRPPTIRR